MMHAEALLRSPYALQCASFLLRVNFESPTRPRAVVQLRTALLQRLGAHAAVLRVSRWLDEHLLPLVDGRVAHADTVLGLHRIDLTADVCGVTLTRMHLDRFITRARERVEYDLPADDQSACARVRLDGRTLSGFTFGARGQGDVLPHL